MVGLSIVGKMKNTNTLRNQSGIYYINLLVTTISHPHIFRYEMSPPTKFSCPSTLSFCRYFPIVLQEETKKMLATDDMVLYENETKGKELVDTSSLMMNMLG